MSKAYLLYNPNVKNGNIQDNLDALEVVIDDEVVFSDLTQSGMPMTLLEKLEEDDYLILCGGDGTLNRFANDTANMNIQNEILYFPCGANNDFAAEFQKSYGCNPFRITQYLQELPTVTVNGKTCRFLNGVGLGIDSRSSISKYKPVGATVKVDGVTHRFEKVWMTPTMYGKFYGGGMIPAPKQKRGDGHLSLMVLHGSSKLKTRMLFSSICKGSLTSHQKYVSAFCGRNITVTFDEPRSLQIDGETIENVLTYTARR